MSCIRLLDVPLHWLSLFEHRRFNLCRYGGGALAISAGLIFILSIVIGWRWKMSR